MKLDFNENQKNALEDLNIDPNADVELIIAMLCVMIRGIQDVLKKKADLDARIG